VLIRYLLYKYPHASARSLEQLGHEGYQRQGKRTTGKYVQITQQEKDEWGFDSRPCQEQGVHG